MSTHTATISWSDREGRHASGTYDRSHRWRFDGGAEVLASASPHIVPVPFSDPQGIDPEEALVASAASCHMLWFLDLARRAGVVIESYTDTATGFMEPDERGREYIARIQLQVVLATRDEVSLAQIEALHEQAHERCFIANSLRTRITIATSFSPRAT